MPKRPRGKDKGANPPYPREKKNSTSLKSCSPSDGKAESVRIGSALYVPDSGDKAASWNDLKAVVQGVRWLIPMYLPYGMLTGLIGDTKSGKSAFVLGSIARSIILGQPWFTGDDYSKPGYVVWCDTERRGAINLERSRKWVLPIHRVKTPFADPLKLIDLNNLEHIDRLKRTVSKYKAPLCVVDSFRGSHKGNENDSQIAEALQNLGGVAEETNTAILLIHHTKKLGAGEEMTANSGRGSNAFLAMITCQWAIDKPDESSEWRRLRVMGENLGVAPSPIGFLISDTGITFGPAPQRPHKVTEKDVVTEWLRDRLEAGKTYRASDILEEAKQLGHNERTVRKAAAERLGIKPKPVRVGRRIAEWQWTLVGADGKRRTV